MSKFQEQVNELVGKMTKTDNGKWILPEELSKDLSEELQFAVTAERRVRDTQGAFTKSQQELKKQEAIAKGLEEKLMTSEIALTKEQRYELNELKKTDPEKWRAKLNEYETKGKEGLNKELDKIRKESSNKGELEVRKELMEAWSNNTGIQLTDEIVDNDLPPRFKKDLEAGKITFEEFLNNAGDFLTKIKVVQGSDDDEPNEPNLGEVAGGKEPSKTANEGDFNQTYEKETVF
jgi:hypothetical protein